MKHTERLLPFLFVALLAGGFYACEPEEEITEKKGPDTIQTQYGEIIVSEDYVPIDWAEGKNEVLSIEVPSETQAIVTMQMEDKKMASQIQKGAILTLDLDTAMYLRKVVSSTIDGTTVKAVTEQATLEDVFSGSEFELCIGEEPDVQLYEFPDDEDAYFPDSLYDEEEEEEEFFPFSSDADEDEDDDVSYAPWARGHGNDRSAGETTSRVNGQPYERSARRLPQFQPTELRYYDENGNWVHESYNDYVARRTTRGDGDPHSIHFDLGGPDCIDFHTPDDDGFTMGIKGGATFSCDLGFKMSTNYGDGEFISTYKKGNVEITPVFFFEPYLYLNLQCYIKGEKKLNSKTTKKIEPTLLARIPGPKAVFNIGPVPMWVTAEGRFYAEPEFTFSAEADVTFGGVLKTDGPYELGLKWSQKNKKFTRVSSKPNWVWEGQKPTLALSGKVEDKIYVYPRWDVSLYDIIGPYIALKPYVRATVSAGVNTTTAYAWQFDAALGCEFTTGIKAEVVGYELARKDFASKQLGKEISLWCMPFGISSNDPGTIKVGQLYDIDITVLNKFLTGRAPNRLIPVSVHFETEKSAHELYEKGSISGGNAKFAMNVSTVNGVASVTWCPLNNNSTLTASIYSPDGRMVDFISFHPDNTPDGVKAIDMGTGILWADCNLGADMNIGPSSSGSYAGWGDVSAKHREQCFDESYDNYVEDEEKCYKYYGGNSPHSNISGTKYDIVTTTWGGDWRLPTKKEWDKLIKACKVKWATTDDGAVYTFTNNGKELIFPAAGYEIGEWWSGDFTNNEDGYSGGYLTGEYWSGTLDSKDKKNAIYCGMSGTGSRSKAATGSVPRYYRQSIRPVKDKK